MKFEKEVFIDCGAWKNFHELEDSLSLDELIVLYEASVRKQTRFMKTMAMVMGAEVDMDEDEDDDYSPRQEEAKPAWQIDPQKGGRATDLIGEQEIAELPLGLGYSIISNEEV